MKSKGRAAYITFPIGLLKGFQMMKFKEVAAMLTNAMNYALYLNGQRFVDLVQAADVIGIKFNDIDDAYDSGKELYKFYEGNPLVSINTEIVFDFYENEKSESEKLVFAVYCGLRSILGKKKYTKSNNNHLIARSLGFKSFKDLEEKDVPIYWRYKYFSTPNKIRYHLTEKILINEISLNWGMKYYSLRNRGFYFGFNISQESLVLNAEVSRKKNRLLELKKGKEEARQKALKMLASLPTNNRNFTPP